MDPVKVPSSVIDDPLLHLEIVVRDIRMVFKERSATGVSKQVGIWHFSLLRCVVGYKYESPSLPLVHISVGP